MVPKRSKEAHKTSEGIPVELTVAIPETQNNMDDRGSVDIMIELKNLVIHKHHIPGQYWGAGKPSSKIIEEDMTVETDMEEKYRRRKDMEIFPTGVR